MSNQNGENISRDAKETQQQNIGKPKILKVEAVTSTTLRVCWEPPPGNDSISYYVVSWKPDVKKRAKKKEVKHSAKVVLLRNIETEQNSEQNDTNSETTSGTEENQNGKDKSHLTKIYYLEPNTKYTVKIFAANFEHYGEISEPKEGTTKKQENQLSEPCNETACTLCSNKDDDGNEFVKSVKSVEIIKGAKPLQKKLDCKNKGIYVVTCVECEAQYVGTTGNPATEPASTFEKHWEEPLKDWNKQNRNNDDESFKSPLLQHYFDQHRVLFRKNPLKICKCFNLCFVNELKNDDWDLCKDVWALHLNSSINEKASYSGIKNRLFV